MKTELFYKLKFLRVFQKPGEVEGFQKWIIRADSLPVNPILGGVQRIKFAETTKMSRQIINPRCKFVSWGVNGLPSTKNAPSMICRDLFMGK
jgi:hypothetical protein